jgi:hypothetical protein
MSECIWHPTIYPGYFVNKLGDVVTFDRCEYMPYKNSIRKIHRKGKELNPVEMNNGYVYVDIANYGKPKRISVHRLMALTFLSEDINHKHIHHIDGNKKNNIISNLEEIDPKTHCRDHNFERNYENKTGYRGVSECWKNRYRGSVQRSGKKIVYTKIYNNPEEAYYELQRLLNE